MKTNKDKIDDLNFQIKTFKKALKDGTGSSEAIEWGEKYLKKLVIKKEKLIKQ